MSILNEFLASAIVHAAFRTKPEEGKIQAIKDLRAATGLGLRNSKDIIEAVERDLDNGRDTSNTMQVAQAIIDQFINPEFQVAPQPKPEPEALVMIPGSLIPYKAKSIEEAKRFSNWHLGNHPYDGTQIFVEQI